MSQFSSPIRLQSSPLPRASFSWSRTKRRLRGYHGGRLPRWHSPESAARATIDWFRVPTHLIHLILLVGLCFVYIFQASIHWLAVIDDAYITFRFVDLFSQGHGWRFSVDGPRVEGFTNFLWALILVVPHWLGGDLMYWSKILGIASGIITLWAAWRLAAVIRGREDLLNLIAPAFLATNTHFGHWAMMGLETLLQTALVTATYYRFEKERRDPRCWLVSPVLAFLAATTRIDSLYYMSPLGVYGILLVFQRRYPLKRLLLWGFVAALPFCIYNIWRIQYFGDFFPNTYYAKQRLVVNEGHGRGIGHLREFYFNQAGYGMRDPGSFPTIQESTDENRRIIHILHRISLPGYNSLLWMNFWLLGGGLTLLAATTPLLISRRKPGRRLDRILAQPYPAMMTCLVLLPWALNVYYVYHVNGDWMPGFRFLQMALPFMGVAGAVGFGWVIMAVSHWVGRRLPVLATRLGVIILAGWLVVGQAYEQMDIGHVYVFGRNDVHSGPREQGWWRWEQVVRAYQRGFVPPLEHVSNWMLLNTQDDAWIFMSDIGQPLWFAEHLGLYDVDGLTDPHLAHAPSVRGDLPTPREIFDGFVRERGAPPDRQTRERWMQEARRQDFDAHLRRNAAYIMEDRQPDYLLIFKNHENSSPHSRGWPYPRISEEVYRHPAMANYVHITAIPKVGNVYNHFYRRSDVDPVVPDEVKLSRMLRALERNPRMPLLVSLLYEETARMDLGNEDREVVRRIVLDALDRWAGDPFVTRLATRARNAEDEALAEKSLKLALRSNPRDPDVYISLANFYVKREDYQGALAVAEKGVPHQPTGNNTLYYHLVWLAEMAGEIDKARLYGREAVRRIPRDTRAWSDLASVLDRLSHRPGLTPALRLELKRESLDAFRSLVSLMGNRPGYLVGVMDRIELEIRDLEEKSD